MLERGSLGSFWFDLRISLCDFASLRASMTHNPFPLPDRSTEISINAASLGEGAVNNSAMAVVAVFPD